MSNAREKYMLALVNLVNGSELGYEDRSIIPQYKKDIEDYVDSLEKVNKEYKEVIDKAIEYIWRTEINSIGTPLAYITIGKELLDILKEV